MSANAVILFEPDGYVLDGPKLMGRQAAGHAFLRAAVAGRGGEPLQCYTPNRSSAAAFARLVAQLDPRAKSDWIEPARLDRLAAAGTLYVPGPVLGDHARLRLRAGPAAYSLVGVTHTTASHGAMDAIAGLMVDPLAPWDALICTSKAVVGTVETVLEAERDYLAWRLGGALAPPMPRLPCIPLGVHTADFSFSDKERERARALLGLARDETVALFVGRLSYHAKAHPHAMYLGLERAARSTGKRIALVQCGWFANDAIADAIRSGAARYAPAIRALFTDGRDEEQRKLSWAAADFFISLSDNVQETFGLAPVEAMAAGLPSVVTDWDGYKDTIRDAVDGYRIATAMPAAGFGDLFTAAHETGEANYDHYCGLVCRTVSVDLDQLTARLVELVESPERRRELGHHARMRARAEFDWALIYARYRALYAELADVRREALTREDMKSWLARAPRASPARLDPFRPFAHYPTHAIGPETPIALSPGVSSKDYLALASDPLFSYLPAALPDEQTVRAIMAALAAAPRSIRDISGGAPGDLQRVLLAAAVLAKMGLVRIAR